MTFIIYIAGVLTGLFIASFQVILSERQKPRIGQILGKLGGMGKETGAIMEPPPDLDDVIEMFNEK